MKNHSRFLVVLSLLGAASSNVWAARNKEPARKSGTPDHREEVRALLKSLETGSSDPVAVINPQKYIQHNLAAADGLAGLGALLKQIPKGSTKANTVRVFQDGNYVFAHTDYNFFGPKIGFDIFRFENGKIVEHWDNLQEKPTTPTASGRSMIDGPTTSTDLDKTLTNKKLVESFVTDILVGGKMNKISEYIDGEHYNQHNPTVADGLSGLTAAFKALAAKGITMKYDKIHRVLGEGNFVLVTSEGSFGGRPTSFYDLFRVDNGKIVEHWDTIETVPPKSEWKNANGKF